MNQPIYVHANSDNLPSLNVSDSPKVDPRARKSNKLTSVGAIVRPMRQGDELDSIRADLPTDAIVPAPHARTNKLEDYVKWLREDASSRRTAKARASLTPDVVMPTHNEEVPNFDNYIPKPSSGFSIDQIQRIDGAHHMVAPPVTSASQFPPDPDWQKLQAHSQSGEVIMPDQAEAKLEATPASPSRPTELPPPAVPKSKLTK